MIIMQVTEFRTHLADVTNKVAFAGERICLERNGKPVVAIVSVEDMELLERLEDQMDLDLAKKAIKRNKFISTEALSKELGL